MMSDEQERVADDSILEPLLAYKTKYQSAFKQNCEEYFDELVKKSGMDLAANRKTVAAYDAQMKLVAEANRTLSRGKTRRTLLILWTVFGALLLLAGIFALVGESYTAGAVLLSVGVVSVVAAVVILLKVVAPALRRDLEHLDKLQEKANEFQTQAWRQMAPLNALFENNVTKPLIEKTVPLLKLDDNFSVRRYDYLSGKYGYSGQDDPDSSTIGILTGEIVGNPFVVDRKLVHSMGMHTYTGSLVIFWETHYTDSDGRTHTVQHTQTLTASVTRPKPTYRQETRLIYGNEAAPDLHFSRRPAHVEDESEKARARKVDRGIKKIRKKQEQAMGNGGSFTEMGNAEFEVLFGALDRDNDVEFRLLFTPLAQKNLLALLKDAKGYGDDFYMKKAGCLNYVVSEHSAQWDMEEQCVRYLSFSADLSKSKFMAFNEQYFRSLYFDLAPLLSIPLYQQHKPHEYIYHEKYPRNFTRQETEYAVNWLEPRALAPVGAETPSILKTSFLSSDGGSDRIRVTASAYQAIERTEYVSVLGGDGNFHLVPVDWIEYIPVSADTTVEMKELGMSEREFKEETEKGALSSAISKYGQIAYGYRHGILCCIVPDEETGFDADFTLKK